jgi:hypothetical protein
VKVSHNWLAAKASPGGQRRGKITRLLGKWTVVSQLSLMISQELKHRYSYSSNAYSAVK